VAFHIHGMEKQTVNLFLHKLICRFKIPVECFAEINKLKLKFIWKWKRPRSQNNLGEKMKKAGGLQNLLQRKLTIIKKQY
jgi:hypothetical protein